MAWFVPSRPQLQDRSVRDQPHELVLVILKPARLASSVGVIYRFGW